MGARDALFYSGGECSREVLGVCTGWWKVRGASQCNLSTSNETPVLITSLEVEVTLCVLAGHPNMSQG
ncbi:hypothetical protein RRG08_051838 [Elysia crispata]|uniref:Uncharacterized protein n=1 Tax=Elysia crispata TaxID=231223 RepID=A0AAE0Z986_9GAST|nr:hypothetical protein RRG08_051838 [Elysia crispata]